MNKLFLWKSPCCIKSIDVLPSFWHIAKKLLFKLIPFKKEKKELLWLHTGGKSEEIFIHIFYILTRVCFSKKLFFDYTTVLFFKWKKNILWLKSKFMKLLISTVKQNGIDFHDTVQNIQILNKIIFKDILN